MAMADVPVLVDALPYIDQGYDEALVREAALAMVEEETKRYKPTKNYLEFLQTINLNNFETSIMKSEFERMQARLPMDMLSMKRYELPHPPHGKLTDVATWSDCVDNSMAQLQHQATRIANLELMNEYGCEAWRQYINSLLLMLNSSQKKLQEIKKKIQEVNWQRKTAQTEAGDKLHRLEEMWVTLVSRNYEIERACAELEKMIMAHKTAKETNVSNSSGNAETSN
ncbi:Pre-mRNA-splicing factor SPF27 [Chamberlinius hualienensis]